MNWNHEDSRSWRLFKTFAWIPTKTMDQGWIWLKPHWRWQCSSGWGFFDDWSYVKKPICLT